jgi:hypothetical protein
MLSKPSNSAKNRRFRREAYTDMFATRRIDMFGDKTKGRTSLALPLAKFAIS